MALSEQSMTTIVEALEWMKDDSRQVCLFYGNEKRNEIMERIDAARAELALRAKPDAQGDVQPVQADPMNLANVIRARWGADWHKEGRDLIAYDEACNDALDLLDVIDALQGKRPAVEVQMVQADWSQLPSWVMWWCVNADGRVAVSDDREPIAQEGWDTWTFAHGILDGGGLPVSVIIPIGTDWRTTLQQRPAAEAGATHE